MAGCSHEDCCRAACEEDFERSLDGDVVVADGAGPFEFEGLDFVGLGFGGLFDVHISCVARAGAVGGDLRRRLAGVAPATVGYPLASSGFGRLGPPPSCGARGGWIGKHNGAFHAPYEIPAAFDGAFLAPVAKLRVAWLAGVLRTGCVGLTSWL